MTTLGKRYFHVIDGDAGTVTTKRLPKQPTAFDAVRERTLVVDLDSLGPPTDDPAEEHERPFTYHGEALYRMGAPTPIIDELARLRTENERMRAVVDAACKWQDFPLTANDPDDVIGPLTAAVDDYRAGTPTTQPADVEPTRDVTPGTLTPAEWSALFDLGSAIAERRVFRALDPIEEEDRRAIICGAIDKLRTAAARPALTATDLRRLREVTVAWLADGYTDEVPMEQFMRGLLDAGKLGAT